MARSLFNSIIGSLFNKKDFDKESVKSPRDVSWSERAVKVVNLVNNSFPEPEFENWDLCEENVRSAIAACERISEYNIVSENAGFLVGKTSLYLREAKSDYQQAESLCKTGLAIYEKVFGKAHPEVAKYLNKLAELYKIQYKYDKAETLLHRSTAIYKKALGRFHPDLIDMNPTFFNFLINAFNYWSGHYKYQTGHYKYEGEYKEKNLGKYHLDVATNLCNLAEVFAAQYRYIPQADLICHRSLLIRESILGKKHPDVAISLICLAKLYCTHKCVGRRTDDSGFYRRSPDDALPLFERSLKIREEAFGYDHPDVAESLDDLANFYSEYRGFYRNERELSAESLYLRSLAIEEKTLDKNHPRIASTLTKLAKFYHHQGKFSEAESSLLRGLAILENGYDKNHPDIASSLDDLATLYKAQGRYNEAKPLFAHSLEIREKSLGKYHPLTKHVRASLKETIVKLDRKGAVGSFGLTNIAITLSKLLGTVSLILLTSYLIDHVIRSVLSIWPFPELMATTVFSFIKLILFYPILFIYVLFVARFPRFSTTICAWFQYYDTTFVHPIYGLDRVFHILVPLIAYVIWWLCDKTWRYYEPIHGDD